MTERDGKRRKKTEKDGSVPRSVPFRPFPFLSDLSQLTKPGIVVWVLITVAAGYYLAAGSVMNVRLLHTLIAATLVAAASSALNQVMERDVDALMRRTRSRPLPAGRMSVITATSFGLTLGATGIIWFAVFTTPVTTFCGVATIGLYVLVYTPLKRVTSLSTLVGAIPGALPIVGGWAASGRAIDPLALSLFGILFLWQLPHFLALAWIYRQDYADAGFPMLSVTNGGAATFRQALLYGTALLPVSLMPALLGVVGPLYFFGAIALCGWLLWATVAVWKDHTPARAWRLFTTSVIYLPAVLALMVIDRAL